jgi:hypothetical protein
MVRGGPDHDTYSNGTIYFGLVVSPTGFTNGCEAWATSHNVGIVPPLKGRRLAFDENTVLRMFERMLVALHARVRLRVDDLRTAPAFFDFVYRLVRDFEGHQEAEVDGRYLLLPRAWPSSFGEMYQTISGRSVQGLCAVQGGTVLHLAGNRVLQFSRTHIQFGEDPHLEKCVPDAMVSCRKNIEMESCALDFVRSIAIGKSITSACDFGSCLEVGLDQRFNLGLNERGFHLFSTENPVEKNLL